MVDRTLFQAQLSGSSVARPRANWIPSAPCCWAERAGMWPGASLSGQAVRSDGGGLCRWDDVEFLFESSSLVVVQEV